MKLISNKKLYFAVFCTFFAHNFFISKDRESCLVPKFSFLKELSNHVLKVYVFEKNVLGHKPTKVGCVLSPIAKKW